MCVLLDPPLTPTPRSFWSMLFFGILIVVMILWRPTLNNRRYAYSSLENGIDEEEFDVSCGRAGMGINRVDHFFFCPPL